MTTQSPDQESPLFVGSVAKAFRVLEAFGGAQGSLTPAELGAHTGLDRSAVQRFTHTLQSLGYLRKDEARRGYALTPKALTLGRDYLRSSGIAEPASPFLREAARQSEETVNLLQLDGNDVVYIVRIASRHVINADVLVGTRHPAWCTATGRVMLAQMSDERVLEILRASELVPYTRHTVTDIDALMNIIRQARTDGYTFASDQIYLGGEFTVAAPVLGPSHQALAAVGITGPASRNERSKFLQTMVPIVMDTAAAISATQGRGQFMPAWVARPKPA